VSDRHFVDFTDALEKRTEIEKIEIVSRVDSESDGPRKADILTTLGMPRGRVLRSVAISFTLTESLVVSLQ
jgi:hypothetical protein